ncbi:MipA/OmpV family protein [Thalassotalea sediminis]|uniref:MipA/OmpV family protein n=1 Tax=Thalassotalea sediminis TaxID=1759089 RepID=UPI0025726D6C|nr:MipA/OmpV family protein [Thalassotalea sediminis]
MTRTLITIIAFLMCANVVANEKKPENQSTVFNETFSWQAQLGLSAYYTDILLTDVEQSDLKSYLTVPFLFDFYYKGFFIQSNHRRSESFALGAELGYQLIVEDDWELDIISKAYITGISPSKIMDLADKEIASIKGLDKRDVGEGIGLRYTRYFQSSQLSIDVANLAIPSDAKGWLFEAFYSHLVPYRNWDIYLNASLSYYPETMMDYYYGIRSHEVSAIRPLYQASGALKGQLEAFVQRPISESWTFNAGVSFSKYSDNLSDSPIIEKSHSVTAMLGVLYVF